MVNGLDFHVLVMGLPMFADFLQRLVDFDLAWLRVRELRLLVGGVGGRSGLVLSVRHSIIINSVIFGVD